MPPFLPPPPQIVTLRSAPTPTSTPSHFRDLSVSQARWLEVLEQNGILHTNPEAEMFGPQQAVRREELLMSEARLVELILQRERQQQTTIEKLSAEVAQLRSANTAMASSRTTSLSEQTVVELHASPRPVQEQAVVEVNEKSQSVRSSRDTVPGDIDISSLVRHRYRLGQFPHLQGFLRRVSQLDPNDAGYEGYLQTYLSSAGMTKSQLTEASRQAAWLDAQGIA